MKEHGPDAIMDPTFRPIVRASFHQSQKIARQQTNKRRMEQEYGGDIFAFDNIQTVDEDGDGLITREDLMRALDTDGDGVVSSEELLAAMRTKARAGESQGHGAMQETRMTEPNVISYAVKWGVRRAHGPVWCSKFHRWREGKKSPWEAGVTGSFGLPAAQPAPTSKRNSGTERRSQRTARSAQSTQELAADVQQLRAELSARREALSSRASRASRSSRSARPSRSSRSSRPSERRVRSSRAALCSTRPLAPRPKTVAGSPAVSTGNVNNLAVALGASGIVSRLAGGRVGDQNTSRRMLDQWFERNDTGNFRKAAMPLSFCRTLKDVKDRQQFLSEGSASLH